MGCNKYCSTVWRRRWRRKVRVRNLGETVVTREQPTLINSVPNTIRGIHGMPGNGGSSSSSFASPSDPRRPLRDHSLPRARATVVRARVLRSSLPVPVRRRIRRARCDRSDPPRRSRSALYDDSLDPRARVQPNLGNFSSDNPSTPLHPQTLTRSKLFLKLIIV